MILPYYFAFAFILILYIYGYIKKSILIFSLSSIILVLISLYGLVHGMPYVSGYTETISGGATNIITNISYEHNYAYDFFNIIMICLGTFGLILMNFEQWQMMDAKEEQEEETEQ